MGSRICCQWKFGEIVYNRGSNDSSIEIVKTHLIDLETFDLPKDSSEYGNNDVRKKVICIGIYNLRRGTIKIIADPYNYGIYKKPKDWG